MLIESGAKSSIRCAGLMETLHDLRHLSVGNIIKMQHKHTGRVVYAQVTSIFSASVGRANRITLEGNEAYLGRSMRIGAADGWCRVREKFPVPRVRTKLIPKYPDTPET